MQKGTTIFWSTFFAAAITRLVFSFWMEVPDASACLKKPIEGVGTIEDDPERKESGQVLIVRTHVCDQDLFLRMKTKLYPRFEYGQGVLFSGNLSAPYNFRGDSGRSFDYQGFLAKDDIFYEIKSAKVELVGAAADTSVSSKNFIDLKSVLYSVKRKFVSNLEKALGEPHSALAAGLVVGEKSALGKQLIDDFRAVGLIHIVVLSGFNITIVAVAFRRLLVFLPRVWGIIIGGLGIALFGVLVGGGATVVRSCFMAGIALGADLIRRDYSVYRALGFAALVMLIQNPLILLNDPSFQLSFLATLGLVILAKPLEDRLTWITDRFGIRGIIATSFATQIFVSPYILYMMGEISIIGFVVNILVLPIIPLTMLVVFLTGALGLIHPILSTLLGWFAHILLSYELFIVETFARFPYASATLPPFSIWWVAGFYGVFICVYYFLSFRKAYV